MLPTTRLPRRLFPAIQALHTITDPPDTPMTITLNGKPESLDGPLTVAQLLAHLGLAAKPVVVELNQAALTPSQHATAVVEEGARIEIVVLAAGG
jgi:thiamine biosynthesis protein ThiS